MGNKTIALDYSTEQLVEKARRQWEYIRLDTGCMVYVIDIEQFIPAFDMHDVLALESEAGHKRHRIICCASYDIETFVIRAECWSGAAVPSQADDNLFRGFISSAVELLLIRQYFKKKH